MKKQRKQGKEKTQVAMVAVLVSGILIFLTLLFIQGVQTQLWEQSISTILESTRQGCNTLRVQLQDDYESLERIAGKFENSQFKQREELEDLLQGNAQAEKNISLYLLDGSTLPGSAQRDETAVAFLQDGVHSSGIIDPHISNRTGMNVFHLFYKVTLQDGTVGYLLKEYEVEGIVDSFSLSFYNDAGFSYVVNTKGDILIRPPHPNSNKTVQNLFDMLSSSENNTESQKEFEQSLTDSRTGWAVFSYQGKNTVFCYTPLKLQTDWYVISIIPQDVVNTQTNQILMRSFALIGSILLGIALLLFLYISYVSRTKKKLKNQADYIGHLYNAIPEGIALFSVESPYHFLQMNQEGLRLLNYPEDTCNHAIHGMCLKDVIHPEDYSRIVQLYQDTAARGEKNLFEIRIQKVSGGFFWGAGIVEKTLDENGSPVLITAIHDVTEKKLAQEAAERDKLQERMTLVGAISNAYPVIIRLNLTKDTCNFIFVKPGLMIKLDGLRTYSELFRTVSTTVHADQIDEFKNRFAPENLNKTLGIEKNEVFVEAKQLLLDGQYHWISTQIISVDNPYSDEKLAILISRRIDEQRYKEEQRRQALQSALDSAMAASSAKSQFLSNMSHDIRTPMNAIVGMTAIAAAHLNDTERVAQCLKKISLSGKHLLSLINDVLDMSKVESGKLSLREEPFNFAELIADSVELVRPQADANQLVLDVHLPVLKNEKVIGDPLRVRQICINILSNAVKYTPAGGSVHIEAKQLAGSRRGYQNYIFRCADTGFGMTAEFLEKLFQPFERAQCSTTNKIMGTGLGMAITKNLVDLMNGDIQVESKPMEGTVFTVTLPLQLQDAQQESIPEEWVGVHSLIVDDDRQTCENAAKLLLEMGLRAQFVTQGKKAVQLVMQAKDTPDPFQLIIVDWKMPDMDGVEVAKRIRSKIGPKIPVIVLTAYDWSEIENEAREAGVTAFLSKPFYRSKMCYLLRELSEEKTPVQNKSSGSTLDFSQKRVLLVEDNEMNREIARTLIEDLGVQVEEACDGNEAVRAVSKSGEGYYDLIFMDVQMPNLNGYEATKQIRALKRQDVQKLPIVAMTANAFEEDVREALRAGMNAHFAKPIDVKELEKLLYQYLIEGSQTRE